MRRPVVAVLAVVALLASCSDAPANKGPYPVGIMSIDLKGGQLLLSLAVCNDEPEQVLIYETQTEVRLAASSAGKPSMLACANGARALLGSVVGPRRVVDAFDGNTLRCSFNRCYRSEFDGLKPQPLTPSKALRPFGPRKPGSASLPWDAPLWHPEDTYLDISFFPRMPQHDVHRGPGEREADHRRCHPRCLPLTNGMWHGRTDQSAAVRPHR